MLLVSGKREVKLTIKLTQEQSEGYPVSTETLNFIKELGHYRLVNIPFFVDNLSMEDVISVRAIDSDLFEIDEIVNKSKNSTIWVTLNDSELGNRVLSKVHNLGCGYEGGVLKGYYTINVPYSVDIDDVFDLLDEAEEQNILLMDYPSIRQGE